MSEKVTNIEHIMERIIFLLRKNDSQRWIPIFKELLHDCSIKRKDEVAKKILSIYGGMGSFDDLILHKNYKPVLEDNDELDKLRKELYSIAKDISLGMKREILLGKIAQLTLPYYQFGQMESHLL